jgi:dihydroorotase-like cyclic amidohydrolase
MQAGWTMYESMKVKGQVQATYVRGTIVYEEGTVVGKKGYGKWIKKTRNYDL